MNRNTRNAFIRQMLQNETSIEPSPEFSYNALIKSRQDYDAMYSRSIADPEAFWADMATEHLDWFKPWDAVEEYDFDSDEPFVRYFRGGELNASCNCIDRHLNGPRRNKAALIWQGEPTEEVDVYTYQRLHREVCKAANMLRRLGVRKGDRVVLYMPMVPQLAISMLACARIGAIHCVVFSGLSAESLKDRIVDSGATVVITSNYGYRSGKILRLKEICDKALDMCPQVESCVVVRRIEKRTAMKAGRDFWWDDVLAPEAPQCEPERMEANDPLFILYTSGSTAKPKGILHGTGGYLLYATLTSKYVFDLKEHDIFWCTADAGWITGHSYLVYGPLSNGTTSLMFEGVPNFPKPDRFWEIVEKFGVNILYTAPTAVRSMMKDGDRWVNEHDISTLRLLGRRAHHLEGLDVVLLHRRSRHVPHRRHVVANRDGRHHDHLDTRRSGHEARIGGATVLRHRTEGHRSGRSRGRCRRARQSRADEAMAGHDAGRVRQREGSQRRVLPHPRLLPHGRWRLSRRGWLLLDHGSHRRRDERVGPPHRHGRS